MNQLDSRQDGSRYGGIAATRPGKPDAARPDGRFVWPFPVRAAAAADSASRPRESLPAVSRFVT